MVPTVGAVEYVNAKPLIARFESLGADSPVRLIEDVPSRLPALLDSGEAEAILVSSFHALSVPGRTIAEGCVIATHGPAESVRLFSKVEFSRIESVALDSSSMTSNQLALLILANRYGVRPRARAAQPNLWKMLERNDAALLIGDIGMTADGHGLLEIDLGTEWTQLTGLPFVWALWVGDSRLSPTLISHLIDSRDWGIERLDEIVAECATLPGWNEKSASRYLTQTMNYTMTSAHMAGFLEFQRQLVDSKLLAEGDLPTIVRAEPVRA